MGNCPHFQKGSGKMAEIRGNRFAFGKQGIDPKWTQGSRWTEFTLGLAFGNSLSRAVTALLQSLAIPFQRHHRRFQERWERPSRKAHVPRPAGYRRHASGVGSRRVHKAAPFDPGRGRVRSYSRGRRALPQRHTQTQTGDLEIEPPAANG
jgi:hypothetical protein